MAIYSQKQAKSYYFLYDQAIIAKTHFERKNEYMNIRLANNNDNQELKNFFNKHSLIADIEYQLLRSGNFLDRYSLNSQASETHILTDNKQNISGMMSLLHKKAYLSGKIENVSWLTDMRLGNSREAILHWAKNYADILNDFKKRSQSEAIFTVLSQSDQASLNFLIRPRLVRKNMPRYHLVRPFRWTNVHGKLPFSPQSLKHLKVRSIEESDLEKLSIFLNTKSKERILGTHYTPELLQFRLLNWPGFNKEMFYIAEDKQKNIVGCYALWDSHHTQQVKIVQYNEFSDGVRQAINALSYLKLTKALPPANSFANFCIMSHFYSNNADIFLRLIEHALEKSSHKHFVSFCHFGGDLISKLPRYFLASEVHFGLYSILNQNERLHPALHFSQTAPAPELDLALI